MSRPVGADSERTKRRLIETAGRHFSSHGPAGTSLRDVATDAGVSLATIHHYFGTKQQLHDACVEALYAELAAAFAPMQALLVGISERVRSASVSEADPTAIVSELVRSGFRIALEHQRELKLVMRPWWETGELDERWRYGSLIPFLETVSEAMAEVTGRPPERIRLEVQSIVTLGMRNALTSPRELAEVAGIIAPGAELNPPHEARAYEAIEEHLVAIARTVLLARHEPLAPHEPLEHP